MIEVKDLSKTFQDIRALDSVTATIQDGHIFGLVGSNGAGKSTFLRIISGVMKPDTGVVNIDGLPVYENPDVKRKVCFLADTGYFFPNATPRSMRDYYAEMYPDFDKEMFDDLAKKFQMNLDRKIHTFSKGMKKQLSVLLGSYARMRYLLCDETFDGLDPVMRNVVKSLFAVEVMDF